MLYNEVVPVRAVTTLWLNPKIKLWYRRNTIKNIDPELSLNVVMRQRLVLPGKDMPGLPCIDHRHLHTGVLGPI